MIHIVNNKNIYNNNIIVNRSTENNKSILYISYYCPV